MALFGITVNVLEPGGVRIEWAGYFVAIPPVRVEEAATADEQPVGSPPEPIGTHTFFFQYSSAGPV